MTPAQRLLIVIGGCLILAVLSVFILYPLFRSAETPAEAQPTPTITDPSVLTPLPSVSAPAPVDSTVITPAPAAETSVDARRAEVERLTRLLVELFGSYSNFSNFENITSMEPFMTSAMKRYAETLKKAESGQSVTDYYGVTSTIISLTTAKFEAKQKATVNFVIQQETQQGLEGEIQSVYRDGRLELVYQDNGWLVDGLFYNK